MQKTNLIGDEHNHFSTLVLLEFERVYGSNFNDNILIFTDKTSNVASGGTGDIHSVYSEMSVIYNNGNNHITITHEVGHGLGLTHTHGNHLL